jgi:hypothetical protein
MKLIENWRLAHRMSSVQLNALAIACDGAFIGVAVWYESFPMSPVLYAGLRAGLTVASTVARLIQQRRLAQ